MSKNQTFSILITTKNRKNELFFTLNSINTINSDKVEIVVFDDGSSDGTSDLIKEKFPSVLLYRNEISKGYMYCRNFMLNTTQAKYAISLDDDSNFLSDNPLEKIKNYFINNHDCGVIAFRIFWSDEKPNTIQTNQKTSQVKGFVGCGHAWRMDSWKVIPNYPEWFVFYGEEEYASYQLFKKKIQIHYLPSVLVHHRVKVQSRKLQSDYIQRQRRSLRSGWYLYFLFFPLKVIPKKISYSIYMQIKNKTFKGNFKATFAMIKAIFDLLLNLPKLSMQSNRLSIEEYNDYQKLEESKIYWTPNED